MIRCAIAAGLLVGGVALVPAVENAGRPARWDLMILDAEPDAGALLNGTAAADIDGDGKQELLVSGDAGLLWYRPQTFEKGKVSGAQFHVGLAIADIDGDGAKEAVAGELIAKTPKGEQWGVAWYRPGKDLSKPWARGVIDSDIGGGPHDVVIADIDGDGKPEVIASAMYTSTPGLYIYRRSGDPTHPWIKSTVQSSYSSEGTAIGDIDGDGKPDIIQGPYWYKAPAGGPFAGTWTKYDLAPDFREMCRGALVDVNGDGKLDAVLVESEYPDGRFSWFENRGGKDPKRQWLEHRVDSGLNFAHTLVTWTDKTTKAPNLFVAEMSQGGWSPPYNWDARLFRYDYDRGRSSWNRELMYQGSGTHQAVLADIDGDGVPEVLGKDYSVPKVEIWKKRVAPLPGSRFEHRFIDREKPYTGTDIFGADVDGDGLDDIVCGAWWYKNPTWERRQIPGVEQVINAHDIDGDGKPEFIGITAKHGAPANADFYDKLSSDLVWLKPVDAMAGQWTQHVIGSGHGDWPHSTVIAPLLPGKKLALVTGYHDALQGKFPEIFEIPANPAAGPWPKRTLAAVPYGEEMVAADLDGDGDLDIAAGNYWLENKGDGTFTPHQLLTDFASARVVVTDVDHDGKPDMVVSEERLSYETHESYFARIAWIRDPGAGGKPEVHVIDRIRCPHSLAAIDVDGDGELEILAGEHDPFKPYRNRGNLYVYKKADRAAHAWYRYVLDDRFEHHDGVRPFRIAPGRIGILSHGWAESSYVHLWEPVR